MSATTDNSNSTPPSGPSPRSSAVPLLSETKPVEDEQEQSSLLSKGKRKLLGLGKKKEGDKKDPEKSATSNPAENPPAMSPTSAPTFSTSPPPGDGGAMRRPHSPLGSPRGGQRESSRSSHRLQSAVAASPNRRSMHRSSSPAGLHSPASSQIFERNVQEETALPVSPHLPAHIQTENHIPPVLEASSLAITDDHLNPDEVEIVMHSAHQPASAAVAGSVTDSVYSPSQEDFTPAPPESLADDGASNYGSLDTTDVRRLSFISFADVVQAEHVENNRDAMQFMSISTANRSPSPVRSPASSHGFSTSPPTSGAASEKGADLVSPKVGARAPGSPTAPPNSPPPAGSGELQIETMRQALRKTGSGDLSGARSQPMSAVSLEENVADQPPFK